MTIKLHYHPLSTYSRRVLIGFAEKQIPHELVVVDMAARRHREQPYLTLNPDGRAPSLEEDGFVLFEKRSPFTTAADRSRGRTRTSSSDSLPLSAVGLSISLASSSRSGINSLMYRCVLARGSTKSPNT